MEMPDISAFIDHWHQAVREELQREEEKKELEPLANYLKQQVQQNRTLRNLAASPLLCAMLCALSRERRQQLPVNRIELYRACCQMLLERRDKESRTDLSDYPSLTIGQKERVLQELAYWMIQEQLSEANTVQVDELIASQLAQMPNLPFGANAKSLRLQLVERSSLLREPVEKKIDFAHRTFEEFFAAQAALDASDIEKLIMNAHDVQWREVIILAAGLASKAMCEQLISGLIKRGDEEIERRHQLYLLAVSCRDTAVQLQTEIKSEVEQRLSQLVPPKNMGDAKVLATAGDLAVKHLTKKARLTIATRAACIRTLAMIGSEAALDALESYAGDPQNTIVNELLKAWDSFDREIYAKRILSHLLRNHSTLNLERVSSIEGLQCADLTNLTVLNLSGCVQLKDLAPLANLVNLTVLNFSGCVQLKDLAPLTSLVNLTVLNLSDCSRLDTFNLTGLTNITELSLSGCFQLNHLDLTGLVNLAVLNLSGMYLS